MSKLELPCSQCGQYLNLSVDINKRVEELVRRAGKIADHVLKNTLAKAHHYEARMVRAAIKGVTS